jgi:uncharacterized Tic20 family protein
MDPTTVRPGSTDRNLSALAHLALLFTGMGGLMIPLLIWSARRRKSVYTACQSLQAVSYQVIQAVYSSFLLLVFSSLMLVVLMKETSRGIPPPPSANNPFLPLLVPGEIIYGLLLLYYLPAMVGIIACLRGKPFEYPILGRRVRAYLLPGSDQTIQAEHEERLMAANCHLSQLTPFSGFVLPLITWMLEKDSDRLRFHSLQAFIYQAAGLAMAVITGILYFATAFIPSLLINQPGFSSIPNGVFLIPFFCMAGFTAILILLLPVYSTLPIVAAYRLLKGGEYRYPILGKWLQKRSRPAVRA